MIIVAIVDGQYFLWPSVLLLPVLATLLYMLSILPVYSENDVY